jgi:hypothetical protein
MKERAERLSSIDAVGIGARRAIGVALHFGFAAMQTTKVPVVESLLSAARGLERIAGAGFRDEGLGLAALDALAEIDCAARGHLLLRIADARLEGGGAARGGQRFFKAGEAVNEFAAHGARNHKAAAGAVACGGGGEQAFEAAEIAEGRIERTPRLFLFEVQDVQKAAQGAGGGHGVQSSAASAARRARQSEKITRSAASWVRKARTAGRARRARSRSGSAPGL